jgi:hypothetical protein
LALLFTTTFDQILIVLPIGTNSRSAKKATRVYIGKCGDMDEYKTDYNKERCKTKAIDIPTEVDRPSPSQPAAGHF